MAAGLPQEARLDLDHAHLRPPQPGGSGRAGGGDPRCHVARPPAPRRGGGATVTLDRISESGPTHNDPPIVNVRHFARLEAGRHDEPAVHELARSRSRDRVLSPVWEGSATLDLFGSEHEEHDLLTPVKIGKGFRFTFGYTVDDQEIVKDLRG